MARIYQGAFSAGELSPSMWGRVDLDRYKAGLRIARNMFPLAEGGITKRPGLQFVGFSPTEDSEATRLIPFSFNNEQTYIIVAQQDRLYFINDGGFLLYDMDTPRGGGPISFTPTVTAGATTVVNWANHTYLVGDIIFWKWGELEELQSSWFRVSSVVANVSFTIVDMITGDDVDSTAYNPVGGLVDFGQIYYLDDSTDGWFSAVPVDELDYTGANDLLYLAHPSGPTKVLTRGATHISWTITDFDPAPTTITPTNLVEGTGGPKPAGTEQILYAVTALDNDSKEESLAALVTVDTVDPLLMVSAAFVRIEWDHMAGSDKYRVYKAIAGLYGIVGHVEGTSGTLGYDDGGVVANLSIAPPLEVSPTFDATDEYPGAVELFQQRIWFGRTNDLLRDIYASRSGSLFSFASSGVSTDDDPIEQAISGKSVQEVRHIIPLRDLAILTSDAEWGFDTGDAGAISPAAGLRAQSFWGSSPVKPVVIGNSAIFVERTERQIRDLAYSLQSDGFASTDVSIFAKHLFNNRKVVRMCFAQTPYQILFCVMSDGQAVSCTYVADQQIFAWARHDTNGRMLDCASVTEDGVDNIYVTVQRSDDTTNLNSWIQIERMVMTHPEFADQGMFLDNSVEMNSPGNPLAGGSVWAKDIDGGQLKVAILAFPLTGSHIFKLYFDSDSPLHALNGVTFSGEMDSVFSGSYRWVFLNRTINGDFNAQIPFAWEEFFPEGFLETTIDGSQFRILDELFGLRHLALRSLTVMRSDHLMTDVTIPVNGKHTPAEDSSTVHMGEEYVSEFETLDLDDLADPITGLPLQISGLTVRFDQVVQFSYGRSNADLVPVPMSTLQAEEDWDDTRQLFRGVFDGLIYPGWTKHGRIVLRSQDGFPFTVLAVVPRAEAGDLDV